MPAKGQPKWQCSPTPPPSRSPRGRPAGKKSQDLEAIASFGTRATAQRKAHKKPGALSGDRHALRQRRLLEAMAPYQKIVRSLVDKARRLGLKPRQPNRAILGDRHLHGFRALKVGSTVSWLPLLGHFRGQAPTFKKKGASPLRQTLALRGHLVELHDTPTATWAVIDHSTLARDAASRSLKDLVVVPVRTPSGNCVWQR
jgi:hypothetical protein